MDPVSEFTVGALCVSRRDRPLETDGDGVWGEDLVEVVTVGLEELLGGGGEVIVAVGGWCCLEEVAGGESLEGAVEVAV